MIDSTGVAEALGRMDCAMDRCENVPFASVGGLGKRDAMETPRYVAQKDRELYLAGYRREAERLWGSDWRTAEFGWKHALTIDPNQEPR
jgi:hypothetical protein